MPPDPSTATSLRARAWGLLALEFAALAGVGVASVVIVSEHLRENTAAGAGLFLLILVCLIVLYVNTPRCFASWHAWRAYRRSQR